MLLIWNTLQNGDNLVRIRLASKTAHHPAETYGDNSFYYKITTTPPAKPTDLLTGISYNSVLMLWNNPDDSITGYQILRGDTADSLTVLTDDTGNTSATYTDSTVEPETTYYYAVTARNANGLSEPSDTVTAATPPAPATTPEDEPLVAEQQSAAAALVSNLGETSSGSRSFSSTTYLAQQFHTGDNTEGYQVSEIVVDVAQSGSSTPRFTLHNESSGLPGSKIVDLHGSVSSTGQQRFIVGTPTRLDPDTNYFIVMSMRSGTARLRATNGVGEDSESLAGWIIANNARGSSDSGSTWPNSFGNVIKIAVKGRVLTPPTWDLDGGRLSKSSDCRSSSDRTASEITDSDCIVLLSDSGVTLDFNNVSTSDYNVYIDVNGSRRVRRALAG